MCLFYFSKGLLWRHFWAYHLFSQYPLPLWPASYHPLAIRLARWQSRHPSASRCATAPATHYPLPPRLATPVHQHHHLLLACHQVERQLLDQFIVTSSGHQVSLRTFPIASAYPTRILWSWKVQIQTFDPAHRPPHRSRRHHRWKHSNVRLLWLVP